MKRQLYLRYRFPAEGRGVGQLDRSLRNHRHVISSRTLRRFRAQTDAA